MKKIYGFFTVAALVFVLFGGVANATQYNLGDLVGSNGFIWGDKLFAGFGFSGPIAASNFFVTPTTLSNGDLAIIFQGPFETSSIADFGLNYSVEVVGSSGALIKDISQFFNLTAQGNGGLVSIGETVYDTIGGTLIAQSSIGFGLTSDFVDPPGELTQGDVLVFTPIRKVYVFKDILLEANQGGFVGATQIVQGFSQQVPEPGTIILLGSGLFGLAIAIRRRKK